MNLADIRGQITSSFGQLVEVRARRPGKLIQVTLPALLPDGDGVMAFLRILKDGGLELTDLGHVRMRISYNRDLTPAVDDDLRRIAGAQGFDLRDGQLVVRVSPEEIVAGLFGLAQLELRAEADLGFAEARRERSERFKAKVRQALIEDFGDDCKMDYQDPYDPEGLYRLDAVLRSGNTWVGIALVPNDADAEAAVSTLLHMKPHIREIAGQARPKWVAIPRNLDELRATSKKKLVLNYILPIFAFDTDRAELKQRFTEKVDLA